MRGANKVDESGDVQVVPAARQGGCWIPTVRRRWRLAKPKDGREATRRLAGCGEEGQAGRDVRRQTLMQDQRGGVTYMRRDFMSESAKRLNYLAQS